MQQFILFISYVINCSDQAKNSSECVRIVVQGEEKYFGFNGVASESIYKTLEEGGTGREMSRSNT